MTALEQTLILLILITILSVVGRWLPWPQPITYALGGAAIAFWKGFPRIALDPEVFFVGFLPPLLFSDGWLMPLREFAKAARSITLLATGLVLFTTLGVGLVAHRLIGLPLALGFALGAVISPTDAVAVGAVTERLKVPARLTAVLDGESLLNDASGLVAFRFALIAMVGGGFSLGGALFVFARLVAIGLGVGWAAAYLVGKLRDWLQRIRAADPMIEITLSLLTPFAAYIAATRLGGSGVLGAVAAGLYSGWRDPVRMDPETRQTAWAVWSTVLFWLNGLAFTLLGLQFPGLLHDVAGRYSAGRLAGYVAIVAGMAMALRLIWFFPGAYLPFVLSRRVRERETLPPWQTVLVGGWAGMRGTVTLAAALSLPLTLNGAAFPYRDLVLFLAFGVIAVTLLIQGTTLETLIRWLGLREDESLRAEDRLARIAAVTAGLDALRSIELSEDSPEESAALGRVVGEYEERAAELLAQGETQAHAHARQVAERQFRLSALVAERGALDELWRSNRIVDDVYRPLQQLLDNEESMLRSNHT